jgi:dCTP deaminase
VLNENQAREVVLWPSLRAATYQARVLVEELKSIRDGEYPVEACNTRDLFLCLAEYIVEQLWGLYSPEDPLIAPADPDFGRTKALAELTQEVHSYVRYLRASSPGQTPPGLQLALTQLTGLHFPIANGKPVCLVRPQWKYNLACVLVSWQLRQIINFSVLDPNAELGVTKTEEILPALWRRWRTREEQAERRLASASRPPSSVHKPAEEVPPKQLGVLSFAGLDTDDALLYPLLAHELGHFLDYSYDPPRNIQEPLAKHLVIPRAEIAKALCEALGEEPAEAEVEQCDRAIRSRIVVCIRELLADLLAARMMGFSFFVAQSEFLKSLADWPEPVITESGYPGIQFRLSVVFDHLVAQDNPGNIIKFFEEFQTNDRARDDPGVATQAAWLLDFMEKWRARLAGDASMAHRGDEDIAESSPIQRRVDELAQTAVRGALEDLKHVAQEIVPDSYCARLSPSFFERIRCLEEDLPPILPMEQSACFAEIMSAAWAYQLLLGEEHEFVKEDLRGQFNEYGKTCRLVLKAIELMPVPGAGDLLSAEIPKPITARREHNELQHPGVLSRPDIEARVSLPIGADGRLALVPFNPAAVKEASLDVRLGNWFAIARRTKLPVVYLKDAEGQFLPGIGREELFVPREETFLIHPGDFILGATLEFLALPPDVMAFVEGRSTLGRMGLIVATATQVAPGFHGVVVLELANTGTVPLAVTPGMGIAQLVFQTLTEPLSTKADAYHGKYQCQIKPILTHWLAETELDRTLPRKPQP